MGSEKLNDQKNKVVSHNDFTELWHPSLFFLKLKRKFEKSFIKPLQTNIFVPLQKRIINHWRNDSFFSKYIEKTGLPRQGVESCFGDSLIFKVNPYTLDRLASQRHSETKKKLRHLFIWDSDWDKRCTNFKLTDRYTFISDIWNHRDDLTKSDTYIRYLELLENGKPYRCENKNHDGALLDTEQKIHKYLTIYLSFLYSMKNKGYDPSVTSDPVGVAITRDGELVKINKGLHRLAMAQVLEMDYIEVKIRAVHREWWEKNAYTTDDKNEKFSKITEELRAKNLLF